MLFEEGTPKRPAFVLHCRGKTNFLQQTITFIFLEPGGGMMGVMVRVMEKGWQDLRSHSYDALNNATIWNETELTWLGNTPSSNFIHHPE